MVSFLFIINEFIHKASQERGKYILEFKKWLSRILLLLKLPKSGVWLLATGYCN